MAPSVALRSLNFDCTVPSVETHDEPTLLQKIKHEGSVLSLAVSNDYIFAGTQRNKILVLYMRERADGKVWDIHTYEKRGALKGHQGSVLCLTLSDDKKLLFSSAGDAIVKVESSGLSLIQGLGRGRLEGIVCHLLNLRYWRCLCGSIQSSHQDNLPWCTKHLDTSIHPVCR